MSGVLPDPRRHAYRAGLAAESLRGRVEAPRYVKGERRQVEAAGAPLAPGAALRCHPRQRSLVRRDPHSVRRKRGLGLGAARARWLCRLPAERGPDLRGHDADPSSRRLADLRLCEPRHQDAAARAVEPECASVGGGRGGQVPGASVGRLRHRRACAQAGRACARFRRRGAWLSRHALSVGRAHQPRRRLLRTGAARKRSCRAFLPARRRHAGERSRRASSTGKARTRSPAAISYSGTAMSAS